MTGLLNDLMHERADDLDAPDLDLGCDRPRGRPSASAGVGPPLAGGVAAAGRRGRRTAGSRTRRETAVATTEQVADEPDGRRRSP